MCIRDRYWRTRPAVERWQHIEQLRAEHHAYTDETRLQQVLVNLIDNAVKYSEAPAPVFIKATSTDDQAVIEVSDRGPGIPAELHERVFERFYRVDEARTRSGGTGLGLSIVKTFIEGMRGTVTLSSEENQGCTFTITLPTMPPNHSV